MSRLLRHVLIFALAASAMAGTRAKATTVDHAEAAIAHLRTAVNSQRDGAHLAMLFSLRQLSDPSLKPLFERLVDHQDWQVQVHAVLGLAEIHPTRQVTSALIGRLGPIAQEAVIASAIDLGLLGPEQIEKVLALEAVGDLPRLMLHAEMMLLGDGSNHERLRNLLDHDDLRVAGLTAMLLAETGDINAFAQFQSRFTKAAPRLQNIALSWLVDAARQYNITAASDWLRALYNDASISARDKQFIVLAAFEIDPTGNLDLWRDFLGQSPSYSQRVRSGFMLLAVGENAPVEAYVDLLRDSGDDELLVRMTAAGRALAMSEDPGGAMVELLDLGHPRTTEWVMSTLHQSGDRTAERVYRHLIERSEAEPANLRGGQAERIGLAVTAAARLFALDPEWVVAKLLNSDTKPVVQQALLLGMFESDSPRAGEAAAALTVVGVGREASLRTLLIAKHAETLSEEDLRQLGIIAGGGGRVSEVLRTQAAWLYLKHTGETERAIERLLASSR